MKNLLFIPCYNDFVNCKKILREIEFNYNYNFDILIINDGSKENFEFTSNKFDVKIINLKNNYGIGFGVKFATNYALKNNYKKLCRIDSDGEHDPLYIDSILTKLDNRDFIIGERSINYREDIVKNFSKKILTFLINKFFKLKFADFNCGMMGFNSKSMKIISSINLINYPEPQIIIELCSRNLDYEIVHIKQRKRHFGNSSINFFRGLDFFLVTFFFILNYIMNKK